jgi:hypothetical protein
VNYKLANNRIASLKFKKEVLGNFFFVIMPNIESKAETYKEYINELVQKPLTLSEVYLY